MTEHGRCLIAGIDLAAGRGTTEVALLELGGERPVPVFKPQAQRGVQSDEEIVAVLADAHPSVIAIDAPLSLPTSVVAALQKGALHHDGPSSVEALCERPLAAPAVTLESPYTRMAERDSIWSTLGVRPLPVSFLGGLTFRALVLVPKLHAALPDCHIVEVFPTATLRVLGIWSPEPDAKRQAKTSEAARTATQQGLSRFISGIPVPGDGLLSADLLDALAAALTGVAYFRGEFVAAGAANEGQIVLPSLAFASG